MSTTGTSAGRAGAQAPVEAKTFRVLYWVEMGFAIECRASSPDAAIDCVRELLDETGDPLPGSDRVHYDDGICEVAEVTS